MEEGKFTVLTGRSAGIGARVRFLVGSTAVLIVSGVILFATSGRLDWNLAWAYVVISFASLLITSLTVSASLLEGRMNRQKKEGVKAWDSKILPFILSFWAFAAPFVAGLDMRFGWSAYVPIWIPVAAIAIFIFGDVLFRWAMTSNSFFDTVVRIQGSGHAVAKNGPYRIVRHPGYVGMIAFVLATPLMLGSYWALIPAIASAILLIVRTGIEDKMLHNELAGYKEYARQVRYRLIPGAW